MSTEPFTTRATAKLKTGIIRARVSSRKLQPFRLQYQSQKLSMKSKRKSGENFTKANGFRKKLLPKLKKPRKPDKLSGGKRKKRTRLISQTERSTQKKRREPKLMKTRKI